MGKNHLTTVTLWGISRHVFANTRATKKPRTILKMGTASMFYKKPLHIFTDLLIILVADAELFKKPHHRYLTISKKITLERRNQFSRRFDDLESWFFGYTSIILSQRTLLIFNQVSEKIKPSDYRQCEKNASPLLLTTVTFLGQK